MDIEVLPSSSSLFIQPTAVDCSPLPRSTTFQLHQSSRSLMRPQTNHRTSVSLSQADRNWLDRLSLTSSDHERHGAGRPGTSYLLTLSPIIDSPRCVPHSTFSLDPAPRDVQHGSPASTEYVTAPNSPSLHPTFVPLPSALVAPEELTPQHAGSQTLPEALHASSSLSTSTSYPPFAFFRTMDEAVASHETRYFGRLILQRPRSFSDSFFPSRPTFVPRYSERTGTSLVPELPKIDVGDIDLSFPIHRAKFHISLDQNIEGDETALPLSSYECVQNLDITSGHGNMDIRDNVNSRDTTRRFHALAELLTSESGYLNDLKALVQIYLHNLSGMTYRAQSLTRVPSFLMTGPWIGPYSSSQSCSQLSDATSGSSMMHRRLFTESEIKLLARNAEDLLLLHQGFLDELEATASFLGFAVDPGNSVPSSVSLAHMDAAVEAITRIFVQQASRFHVYQDFCAGHLEALEIIRTKQHQHPVEWDAFEHQCALAIAVQSGLTPELPSPTGSLPGDCEMLSTSDRKRTTSLTTLDGAIRSLRAFASRENVSSSSCDVRQNSHARRLMFMDYLIKPVQRICKYPLLLEQLRPVQFSKDVSPKDVSLDINMVVKESVQAMKDIVAAVDEARHQRDVTTKSSLITSRILRSAASGFPLCLSSEFLSSLGNCLLAGSLTIIHQRSSDVFTGAKPKNLGAFLYPGGYLILVRVLKGKIYEPRHWFCLADFDVQDMTTDTASPASVFCLLSATHVFELAAACPGEKNVWLSTIRVSLAQSQVWIDEPISSLGLNESNDFKPDLPIAQSDFGCCTAGQESSGESSCSPSCSSQNSERPRQDYNLAPTRTSSSVSIKTIFSQGTDVVRRHSVTAKQQTDDGLRDVVGRACLDARACRHDGQGVKTPFARSSSAVSLRALTRGRLPRHETATVSRHNSLPSGDGFVYRKELMKAKSMIIRRSNRGNKTPSSISERKRSVYLHPGTNTDQAKSRQPTSLSADSVDDPRDAKENFQAPSTSAINNATVSIQQSSLQRVKSANSIFRRLSTRAPFRRSTPNITGGMP